MPSLVGSSYVTFVVALSIPLDEPVHVSYYTEPGTGVAGVNYQHTEGSVTFEPGEIEQVIQVLVYGLPANNTTPKTFRLRLAPSPGAILTSDVTEATIQVGDPEVTGSYQVVIAQGPKGNPGPAGREISLRATSTHVQWKYSDADTWTNLVTLESLRGDPFKIEATGLIAERGEYDGERIGFSFFATDEELLYFRVGAQGWSEGITFGKGEQGDPGVDGQEIQLQKTSTEIQWRYAGGAWMALVALADLKGNPGDKGDDGDPGPLVELQASATHIQWRVEGGTTWTNLVPLSGLKGDPGEPGVGLVARGNWAMGLYHPGEYVTHSHVIYVLNNASISYQSNVPPDEDPDYWTPLNAPPGEDGADGREVELQKTATHIQWRYTTNSAWTNLVALDDIRGGPGDPGNPGADGREVQLQTSATHIQWRYSGETEWNNLFPLADLKGEPGNDGENGSDGTNGKDVELQKTATHIQWRLAGAETWNNLVLLADLKGDKGDPGTGLNNRGQWAAGTFNPGDYVFSDGVMYVLQDDEPYASSTAPDDDPSHWTALQAPAGPPGTDGSDGEDGREVELRKTATHLEWRYVGDPGWTSLVALAELKGAPGDPGADGKNIELQKTATHIQWREVGGTWADLVALADLKGDPGDAGSATHKFSATVGNGSATTLTVTHNLNSQDVVVSIREVSSNAGVLADWVANTVNTVQVIFATAPASNAIRVTVVG